MSIFRKNGNHKNRNHRGGSVLLEALLSVVILSVSISWITQSLMTGLKIAKYSGDYFKAILVLENDLVSQFHKDFFVHESESGSESAFDDSKFKMDISTQPFETLEEETPGEEMPREILSLMDATVTWKNRKKNKKVFLSTYVFQENEEE